MNLLQDIIGNLFRLVFLQNLSYIPIDSLDESFICQITGTDRKVGPVIARVPVLLAATFGGVWVGQVVTSDIHFTDEVTRQL